MDDGPVAPAAEHGLSGPALDSACRAVLELPPHPAIARPVWWDAGASARRVSYDRVATAPLATPPWPARQALDFCAELALALAPVHEAGAAHGALRPEAVSARRDGGPLVQLPGGGAGAADDLHGIGVLLLRLLAARGASPGLVVAGEDGPAAATAELVQALLADDPAQRPESARAVGERLSEIAASVPDTAADHAPAPPPRRRARIAAALVLLVIAGASGAFLVANRVGPPGPALSPGTVSVPEPPAVTP